MKANKQSNIKIPKSGYKRSRFNWSHDVNTTFSWGEIQPTMCKLLIPNSKTTVQAQTLVRLAPMVAPTFGRVKLKTYSQFVPCADIFPNFEQMLAQEPITRNGKTFVPKSIPSITLGQLSSYVLFGARANIYWADDENAASEGYYKTRYRKIVSNTATSWLIDDQMSSIIDDLQSKNVFGVVTNGILQTNANGILPHVTGFGDRVVFFPRGCKSYMDDAFTGNGTRTPIARSFGIPLSNKSMASLFPIDRSLDTNAQPHPPVFETVDETDREVTMEGADYVLEFYVQFPTATNRENFAIAFELSDYGKRLRKILQGLGYQIDFASTEKVSILPLLAQYKAYFDVFGLQLYQGWETTACAGLIDYISNNFVSSINGFDEAATSDKLMYSLPDYVTADNAMSRNNSQFVDFMLGELANEWYTESADFIGAHLGKLAVSPSVSKDGFISVDQDGISELNVYNSGVDIANGLRTGQTEPFDFNPDGNMYVEREIQTNTNAAVFPFISSIYHGEVDAEFLKRVYKWTNRNTILGREIAKILRAQGFGKYVDECKSNYIGATDNLITISDVVATSNTEQDLGKDPNTGKTITSGAVLGEYGGKGLQYCNDKTFVFENDEYGYWITLSTIVPEAGYTQGMDPTLKALDKFNLYNPDFDALGMEMTTKDTVVGCRYILGAKPSAESPVVLESRKGFGFIPRYSKFKVCQNLVNGDFNRHNRRNVYLPYTLDRQLNINDYDVASTRYLQETSVTDNSTGYVHVKRSSTTNSMPIAGNIWRIPTKYGFLGNFDRIFYNVGKRDNELGTSGDSSTPRDIMPGFTSFNDDNFLSHGIIDCQCYAPMKPIEDSYGLEEEDPDKAGAEFVSKA